MTYAAIDNDLPPTHPDTIYAQTKYDAEQIVLNARDADGQPLGTVLRLGAVYGSRITSLGASNGNTIYRAFAFSKRCGKRLS
jgi:nucleoside-diphosphate-sugar epimerase